MSETQTTPRCYSYIRFSTPEQIKGNSLDRQLELSREYARERGLTLDESLTMKDLGLSAFSGENRMRGAFGEFLKLVRARKIPSNSTLLVESLDRISREQVMDAFTQFSELIRSGITIVTLSDRMEYRQDSLNRDMGQLFMSLSIMVRAHEESLQKSKRIGAAWGKKRELISDKKLTRKAPAWLELDHARQHFHINKERTEIVKRIYDMSRRGVGVATIAKKMNLAKIASWKGKTGWHPSYIQKILHSKAVLGEFQPHKIDNGKRVPEGDPVSDYFPPIISSEVFYQVQERLKNNRKHGGKNGTMSNLFGGLARCGYCAAPMQFINKGKPPKGGTYLVCDNARRGRGCHYISFSYPELEDAFLGFCIGLRISDLLTDDAIHFESKLSALQGILARQNDELENVERKIRNLIDALSDEGDKNLQTAIKSNITELLSAKDAIITRRTEVKNEIEELMNEEKIVENALENMKSFNDFMNTASESERYETRHRLRAEIRQLVDHIIVFPAARLPTQDVIENLYEMEIDHFKTQHPEAENQVAIDSAKQRIDNHLDDLRNRKHRHFIINFKNGNQRMLVYKHNIESNYSIFLEKEKETYTVMFGKKIDDQ